MTDGNTHITYSFADIERYLTGSMTAKEMHDMERAALQDPFLADAIEGYRNADMKLADRHLNEITAALQKEEPAKVILMPKKKRYGWLIAASLLAVIGTGIFLFTGQHDSSMQLATNNIKKIKQKDSPVKNAKPSSPQTESQPAASAGNLAQTKPENKEADNSVAMLQKKKPLADKETGTKLQTESEEVSRMSMASPVAPAASVTDTNTDKKPLPQASQDSINSKMSLSEVVVTKAMKRQNQPVNTWTTDKGKPFLLSDVEVINLNSKKRKRADTSSIQPEGGWRSFQDYLFSRLSRRDSLLLVNDDFATNNIELEFSVDKSGLPYDIKVFNTSDSTVSNRIVTAIQSGPKWKSTDSKEKRLHIRY